MRTKAKAQASPTPGPWEFVLYGHTPEMLEKMRQVGMEPPRALTNEGQASVMGGLGDDRRLVALVECQAEYKRGQGHTAECAERDANARLIAIAPALYAYVKAKADDGDAEAVRILDGLIIYELGSRVYRRVRPMVGRALGGRAKLNRCNGEIARGFGATSPVSPLFGHQRVSA